MKVVILAGGYGTRLATSIRDEIKPLKLLDEKPIIWHIMKEFSYYGYNDFIICAGYKQEELKAWFLSYFLYNSNIKIENIDNNKVSYENLCGEKWNVQIIDTGLNTNTAGRLLKIKEMLNNEPFLLTYCDGVSDIDISKLITLHKSKNCILTFTSVLYNEQKGYVEFDDNNNVIELREKSSADSKYINGGYMVIEPKIFEYITSFDDSLEKNVIPSILKEQPINTYIHNGFWKCMDTQIEYMEIQKMIKDGKCPWIKW